MDSIRLDQVRTSVVTLPTRSTYYRTIGYQKGLYARKWKIKSLSRFNGKLYKVVINLIFDSKKIHRNSKNIFEFLKMLVNLLLTSNSTVLQKIIYILNNL